MTLNFISFITKHLLIIQKGVFLAKLKSAGTLAITFSPLTYVVEHLMDWSIANQDYIVLVLGAIAIDHILGTLVHFFIKRDFSIKINIHGILIKLGLVVAMGFLFEGLNNIIKEDSFIKSYLTIVLRLTVFLYPAGSAFVNSSIITRGKFPPIGWINKVKKFSENLDLNEMKGEVIPDHIESDIENEDYDTRS